MCEIQCAVDMRSRELILEREAAEEDREYALQEAQNLRDKAYPVMAKEIEQLKEENRKLKFKQRGKAT